MIVVAGKTEPIRVYEVLGLKNGSLPADVQEFIGWYAKGLSSYRERDWSTAVRNFQHALILQPEDYPSQMYIERSHLYLASPPPDAWNGVFVLRTK
jgi:adenylate cyclase